ncbi:unnamed protein product [Heligmosomoides polygyrus]|uniref:Transposase n=1 Tax=Heligmosomoides polygyrus TaxID=6339 RepID=A0A183G7Z0_HELPZ|nr:unnamed protein product [Heligmosomoides polygyrus]
MFRSQPPGSPSTAAHSVYLIGLCLAETLRYPRRLAGHMPDFCLSERQTSLFLLSARFLPFLRDRKELSSQVVEVKRIAPVKTLNADQTYLYEFGSLNMP